MDTLLYIILAIAAIIGIIFLVMLYLIVRIAMIVIANWWYGEEAYESGSETY